MIRANQEPIRAKPRIPDEGDNREERKMNAKRTVMLLTTLLASLFLLIPTQADARTHFHRPHPVAAIKRAVHHVGYHIRHLFHHRCPSSHRSCR